MQKSIEQLRKLAKNPFYQLSDEDKRRLAESEPETAEYSLTVKKNKGIVTAKQIGVVVKQSPGIE